MKKKLLCVIVIRRENNLLFLFLLIIYSVNCFIPAFKEKNYDFFHLKVFSASNISFNFFAILYSRKVSKNSSNYSIFVI